MKKNFILKIEKRSFPEWLTLWIFFLPLMWGVIFDLLHLPSFLKYTADLAWVLLLAFMTIHRKLELHKHTLPILLLVLGFALYSVVIHLFHFQSPFYLLWGLRNNFRFYVLFFAVVKYLKQSDAEKILKFLQGLFWVNAIVSLFQYFVLGYKQDTLGGIFGIQVGSNSSTIIFFTIVLSYSLIKYFNGNESTLLCYSKSIVALFISALAELKMFFVVFVIIVFACAFMAKFTWKKIFVLLLAPILVIVFAELLSLLFGFDDFLKIKNIWELATQEHYSSTQTVNRLSAIPTLAKTIVVDLKDRVFGLGLGNCDTSAFKICNTPFYQTYGFLRYTFFSGAFLFLEVGYIGLILFISFFFLCFLLTVKQMKRCNANKLHCQLAIIMCILAAMLIFYNAALRADVGYMVYFILALPFISNKTVLNKPQL